MPYLPTSQEWLHQSSLLLQARPQTARITTKYTIERPSKRLRPNKTTSTTTANSKDERSTSKEPSSSSRAATPQPSSTSHPPPHQPPPPPRASLTLKTYDPVSGTCLKYRTDKAAEVGRLIGGLGRLGRSMCGLSDSSLDPEAHAGGDGGGGGGDKPTGVDGATGAGEGARGVVAEAGKLIGASDGSKTKTGAQPPAAAAAATEEGKGASGNAAGKKRKKGGGKR